MSDLNSSTMNKSHERGRNICAYFEPEWQQSHMDEIKDHGFSTALLCIREETLVEQPESARETATYAKSIGLEVWTDLWAFGRVFGGEAASPFADAQAACRQNPAFIELLHDGIDYAQALGSRAMFWDEPHFKDCDDCAGHEEKFIVQLADYAHKRGLKNSVCLTSSDANMVRFDRLASVSSIDDIATDPYYDNKPGEGNHDTPDEYVGKYAAAIQQTAERHGITGHIWVQGFNLPAGQESTPLLAAEAARKAGIRSLGFWGFRACEATPEIAAERPDIVWENARKLNALS